MRQPIYLLRYVVILLALTFAARAHADDRTEARTHYQAGLKFYTSGDYRSAIREFSAAQQLVPADLNNYNLALCYDKLGDAEPAMQYYRAYLDKVPSTDKRAEIEASINRLEAAAKSAAGKKADEQRKIDEQRRAAEDARKAEEARKADAHKPAPLPPVGPPAGPAAPVGPAAPPTAPVAPAGPPTAPVAGAGVAVGVGAAGSVGTPSSGTVVPTGDAQLDRVQSINIDQVRDQRVGGAGSGMVDAHGGPAVAPNGAPTANANGAAGMAPTNGGPAAPPAAPNGQPAVGATDQPKKETPVYKKWWFWAVVAVSAYVVYEIATQDSRSSTAREQPQSGRNAQPSGLTLFSW